MDNVHIEKIGIQDHVEKAFIIVGNFTHPAKTDAQKVYMQYK